MSSPIATRNCARDIVVLRGLPNALALAEKRLLRARRGAATQPA
ncbi:MULTISPECIES: hypothetical protein [Mycetohabitans]|nr:MULTISPECIES: hypothetical protein [Mycetohabitans]